MRFLNFSFDPLLISTLLRMPKRSHTQPLQSKDFSVTNWLGSGHCKVVHPHDMLYTLRTLDQQSHTVLVPVP